MKADAFYVECCLLAQSIYGIKLIEIGFNTVMWHEYATGYEPVLALKKLGEEFKLIKPSFYLAPNQNPAYH